MNQKHQNCEVPDSSTQRASKKELPWFVCAAITTCLVVICYEYSESLEDNSSSTNKAARKVPHPAGMKDHAINEAGSNIEGQNVSQDESDTTGRAIFNVITMIICCFALIVTWSTKSTEDNAKATKSTEENEETKKNK